MSQYLNEIVNALQRIESEEGEKLQKAAELVAQTIERGGLIYTFGCGHSTCRGWMPFIGQAVLPMCPPCWIRI